MTLFVPGLLYHLRPLQAPCRLGCKQYVTIADVIYWIYHPLNVWKLGDAAYALVFGRQRHAVRVSCCIREAVAVDLQRKELFCERMRGIDLVFRRLWFEGFFHQRDANGANVWFVSLQDAPNAVLSPRRHPLESGYINWDFRDSPPELSGIQTVSFGSVGEPMVVLEASRKSGIRLSPPSSTNPDALFTPSMVLDAIHAAINFSRSDLADCPPMQRYLGLWRDKAYTSS